MPATAADIGLIPIIDIDTPVMRPDYAASVPPEISAPVLPPIEAPRLPSSPARYCPPNKRIMRKVLFGENGLFAACFLALIDLRYSSVY